MGSSSLEDLKSRKFYVSLVAEFVGTMFLVLIGCGSCMTWGAVSSDVLRISLCFGFSVATMVWAIANVSGGHINPGVTIGFLAARRISVVRAALYVVFQMLGALAGAGLLYGILSVGDSLEVGANAQLATPNTSNSGVNTAVCFGVELLITFVLVFTVFSSVDANRSDTNGSIPLTIGLSIAMCHLFAVPITGSGMNPARVFGPALVSGTWDKHWAYWVGPLLGGAIAGLLYDFVFAVNAGPTKLRGFFTRDYDNDHYDSHGRKATAPEGDADANASSLPLKEADGQVEA